MGEPSQPGLENVVNVGPVGAGAGAGVTPASRCFVSGRGESVEEITVWKIEDLSEFLELSNEELEENGIVFEAGTCVLKDGTRTAATWKYSFEHTTKDGEDCVGGYLTLLNDRSTVKLAKVSHSVSLSSGGNRIVSVQMSASERKDGSDFCNGREKLITKSELLDKTKETDSLEVSLIVKVFSNDRFKPVLVEGLTSPSEIMRLKGQANLDFGKLLESGNGADVKIRVPKEPWRKVDETSYAKMAHKAILMGRSTIFLEMFGTEESKNVEELVIKDLSPKGLDIFLHYLYTGEVLEDWLKLPDEIIDIADKYALAELKQYCGQNLISAVSTSNALTLYDTAQVYKLSVAQDAIAKFISKNTKAALDGEEYYPCDEEIADQGEDEEEVDDN